MLEHTEMEGVHYWRVARSYLGRALYVTGFYLVDGVLIDCGPPNARRILRPLFGEISARRILITHHHEDHTGNAAHLVKTMGFRVSGHPSGSRELRAISGGIPLYRRVIWGVPEAISYEPVVPVTELARFALHAVETPGHSEDHLCYHVPEKGWLFTGDLYLSGYLRYLREDEDIYGIMDSLRRAIALRPRIVFCNHRGPVPEGEAALGKKLSFLERLRDEVLADVQKGVSVPEMTNRLLRKDVFFRRFSAGELSSQNLIQALARGPRGL